MPWPPSANRYWRSFVRPGATRATVYVGDEGKAYRKAVCEAALVNRWPRSIHVPLAIDVIAFPPNRAERDLDNLWKAMLDSLKAPTKPREIRAGVFLDDSQIRDERIRWGAPIPGGRLHVVLSRFDLRTEPLAGAWPDGTAGAQYADYRQPGWIGPGSPTLDERPIR